MLAGTAVAGSYDDAARTALAEGSVQIAASAETPEARQRRQRSELCYLIDAAARAHAVPRGFFIRLIYKESRFNPRAVSPVGALGIAQFMPGTARLRGLANPFDPAEALMASASFLADLEQRFGSWGLAAAGYNGGPGRVRPFVRGERGLPRETINYVYAITGRTVEHFAVEARKVIARTTMLPGEPQADPQTPPQRDEAIWRKTGDLAPVAAALAAHNGVLEDDASEGEATEPRGPRRDVALPGPPRPRPDIDPPDVACLDLVARLGTARDLTPPEAGPIASGGMLWGAQVAGHPRRDVAMRQYDRLKSRLPHDLLATGPRIVVRRFAARGRLAIHAVQFGAPSRAEAQALCKRISQARAPCVVVKNS